jgi:transcription elongation factor GreA
LLVLASRRRVPVLWQELGLNPRCLATLLGCAEAGLRAPGAPESGPCSRYNRLNSTSCRSWLLVIVSIMPEHIRKKLEAEIQVLEYELNHELPKELKKAVAMGDLSENAEYHMAKQRQEFVRARLGQLKRRMADLSLVNMSNIPKDRAALGSTVVVFDSTKNEEIEYKLVTSEESDVTKGLISTSSPIGRALMGKKVGDVSEVVTPTGKRELEVLKLVTMYDVE